MELDSDDVAVLGSERSTEADCILELAPFKVYELKLTKERITWLWGNMSKSRTLFSDLTRGDYDNFIKLIADPHSFWLEVCRGDEPIGVIYFEQLYRVTDCEAHISFFDGLKRIDEKLQLCKKLIRWAFGYFQVQRISVCVPRIYFGTVLFAKKVGFIQEGRRRDVYRMGGQWVDELLFGITRGDVNGWID